jgi:hypothetical protein
VLGRPISPEEYVGHVPQPLEHDPIATGRSKRLDLLEQIVNSPELAAQKLGAEQLVTRLYRAVLLREPDAGGLAGWAAVANREGRSVVARGLCGSVEATELYR